jgi:hydrogenase maturation protease
MEEHAKILVIGVGNEFRGDDAVGVLVARVLMDQNLPGVQVIEQSGECSDLLVAWEDAAVVFLIDAIQSGVQPGTIHRFEAHERPLPTDFFSFSSHAFGVAGAIELARSLGNLPEYLLVLGVEAQQFETGAPISPMVQRAAEDLLQILPAEIQKIQGES